MESAPAIQKLLDELERMPGVGPKSAQRIAYWLLNSPRDSALRLADAIVEVKDAVHFCSRCFNYAEGDVCEVCASASRDASTICVVSEPRDVSAIERTAAYSGLYHVLGGALSPMDGVGPDDLHITELMARSPPIPMWRARRPRRIWRASSSRSALKSRALQAACPLAAILNLPTR